MDKADKFWKLRFSLLLAFVVVIVMYVLKVETIHVTRVTYVTPTPYIEYGEPTPEPTPQPTPKQPIEIIPLGEFRYTYYTNSYADCKKTDGITKSGTRAIENLTVAADLSVIPMGTYVYLEHIGIRKVQDVGSAVRGNLIDIYYEGKVEDPQKRGQVFILIGGD